MMEDWSFFTNNWNIIWKSFVVFFAALFLLRIAGRKTIADMTIAQAIIMIGLGSLLVQPIASKALPATLIAAFILVITMVAVDFSQLKLNWLENLIQGKAKTVIENGQINKKNLSSLRLTVDTLEMKLRQQGVARIEDVEYATLEVSGKLGYKLKPSNRPATIEEIEKLIDKKLTQFSKTSYQSQPIRLLKTDKSAIIGEIEKMIDTKISNSISSIPTKTSSNGDLFLEVANNKHQNPPPEQLH
jgi:uncharacterized membrane protein YcaP (DUF421 family)